MLDIVTAGRMAAADQNTIKNGLPSLVLMERAALRVVEVLEENELDLSRVLVLCGTGNNAADGVAAARLLCEKGFLPAVCLLGNEEKFSPDLRVQLSVIRQYPVEFVQDFRPEDYSLILDAMFGIGLKRDIGGIYETVIEEMNSSDVPVIAVDIPSGLDADTGLIRRCAVCADITVTFQYAKIGQLLANGPALCGDLYVENIGIFPIKDNKELFALTGDDFSLLPGRDESGNKGTFGKLLIAAGSREICGAAYLCAAAALRCGIGMVKIFTAEENRTALNTLLPEALVTTYAQDTDDLARLDEALSWADAVLAGPGIGTDDFSVALLKRLLQKNTLPAVLDADALNILSAHEELWEEVNFECTITPHVGEMSRLSGLDIGTIKEQAVHAAAEFAAKRNVTCVLKDAVTVTACPSGEVYINTTGSSALATAGSGDVLAGMAAGYLTRYRDTDLPLAAMAVYAHGSAGEQAEEISGADAVCASDLLDFI